MNYVMILAMRKLSVLLLYLFFSSAALFLQAEESKKQSFMDDIKLKGRLSLISGSGVDYIARGEGWIEYTPAFLDFKGRVESKNGKEFQKYRLQFMPLKYKNFEYGLAIRYLKKEGRDGTHGIGVAFRVWGEHWKVPFRYYPDLKLIHSKPQFKYGKFRADCQIIDYHEREVWSLRPGMDWKFTRHFSVGLEGRAYSVPEKNYLGLRVQWTVKPEL